MKYAVYQRTFVATIVSTLVYMAILYGVKGTVDPLSIVIFAVVFGATLGYIHCKK